MNKQTQIRIAIVLMGLLLIVSAFFKEDVQVKPEIGTIMTGWAIFMSIWIKNKYVRVSVLILAVFVIAYRYFA